MARFRNKPLEIDAYQLTEELVKTVVLGPGKIPGLYVDAASWHQDRGEVFHAKLSVITIHGEKTPVAVNDWIITEPDGEHHYPCKPDIFAARYVPVDVSPLPVPSEERS
jgi:hypothetical protein